MLGLTPDIFLYCTHGSALSGLLYMLVYVRKVLRRFLAIEWQIT